MHLRDPQEEIVMDPRLEQDTTRKLAEVTERPSMDMHLRIGHVVEPGDLDPTLHLRRGILREVGQQVARTGDVGALPRVSVAVARTGARTRDDRVLHIGPTHDRSDGRIVLHRIGGDTGRGLLQQLGHQRHREPQRPLPARGQGPRALPDRTGRAEVCLHLVTRSLDPTGKGRARWAMRWKPALNAFAITFAGRIVHSNGN